MLPLKLLLLDKPLDRGIITGRYVEYFGPWAQPVDFPEGLSKSSFNPYPDANAIYLASIKVMIRAANMHQKLANILPELTSIKVGRRFWNIFLGDYTVLLAGAIEDIKTRHTALPEKEYVLGLPANSYTDSGYIPNSWQDFEKNVYHNDSFRLYMSALYLKNHYKRYEALDYAMIPVKKTIDIWEDIYEKLFRRDFRIILRKLNYHYMAYLRNWDKKLSQNGCTSLILDDYSLEDFNFEKIKSVVLFNHYLFNNKPFPSFKADMDKREKIKKYFPFPYGEILALTLPLAALEGLPYLISSIAKERYIQNFKKLERIYTHGQLFNSDMKNRLLIALLADEGKKIISIQHGGGAVYCSHSGMFLDRMLADEYISWGSGYSNYDGITGVNRIRSLPSFYLSNLKKNRNLKNYHIKWDVLLLVLEDFRYIKWIYGPLFPDMAYDYFRRQKTILEYFSARKRTAVKIYPEAYGWNQKEWLKNKYSLIKLLVSGSFTNYISKSRIVIIDYNATGFLEMLTVNKPFLATWNRRWFKGIRLFEELLDKMIDVGIFFRQPEDLIEEYNKLNHLDINIWWNEKERQEVIKEMAYNFAMTSDRFSEIWENEFKKNDFIF